MLETLRRYLRYTSWPIIMAMIALMVIGVVAIHTSEKVDPTIQGSSAKQIIWACIAIGFFVATTIVPYQRIGRAAYPLFALTLALLVLVLLLPPPGIRDVHRWINLKYFKVQPSEIAKLAFIILLAWYLRYGDRYRRLRGLIVPFALTLLPMALILMEPDLGTSLLFLPTLYFMLFMAGAKLRHLLGIVAVATALILLPVPRKVTPQMNESEVVNRKAVAYWTFQAGDEEYIVSAAPLSLIKYHHQIKRIVGWVRQYDPDLAKDIHHQLRYSKMVLGAGRLTGHDNWEDGNYCLKVLPEDHTDFIFSVIGGKWGFAGCVAVLFLYGVIFVFGVEIASITYDPFGRLLVVGALALLFSQFFINVGMTMGLMPITGMTLPLVSYGGSSLVVNCAALGLLVNVGQRRPILLGKRPFEYGQKKERPSAAETTGLGRGNSAAN